MTLSIVTPVYSSQPHLVEMFDRLLLDSLLKNAPADAELVIVDDGSPLKRETEACIRRAERSRRVVYLSNERNEGLVKAVNRGLRAAQGDILMTAHTDLRFPPGSIDSLLRLLSGSPEAGIVGPVLSNAGPFLWQQVDGFEQPLKSFGDSELERIDRFARAVRDALSGTFEVQWILSACMMFRKELTRTVGLFDERILTAGEEVDFALRVREAGYKILVDRSSFVFHGGLKPPLTYIPNCSSQTVRTVPIRFALKMLRDCWYIARKYPWAKLLTPDVERAKVNPRIVVGG